MQGENRQRLRSYEDQVALLGASDDPAVARIKEQIWEDALDRHLAKLRAQGIEVSKEELAGNAPWTKSRHTEEGNTQSNRMASVERRSEDHYPVRGEESHLSDDDLRISSPLDRPSLPLVDSGPMWSSAAEPAEPDSLSLLLGDQQHVPSAHAIRRRNVSSGLKSVLNWEDVSSAREDKELIKQKYKSELDAQVHEREVRRQRERSSSHQQADGFLVNSQKDENEVRREKEAYATMLRQQMNEKEQRRAKEREEERRFDERYSRTWHQPQSSQSSIAEARHAYGKSPVSPPRSVSVGEAMHQLGPLVRRRRGGGGEPIRDDNNVPVYQIRRSNDVLAVQDSSLLVIVPEDVKQGHRRQQEAMRLALEEQMKENQRRKEEERTRMLREQEQDLLTMKRWEERDRQQKIDAYNKQREFAASYEQQIRQTEDLRARQRAEMEERLHVSAPSKIPVGEDESYHQRFNNNVYSTPEPVSNSYQMPQTFYAASEPYRPMALNQFQIPKETSGSHGWEEETNELAKTFHSLKGTISKDTEKIAQMERIRDMENLRSAPISRNEIDGPVYSTNRMVPIERNTNPMPKSLDTPLQSSSRFVPVTEPSPIREPNRTSNRLPQVFQQQPKPRRTSRMVEPPSARLSPSQMVMQFHAGRRK